MKPIPVKYVMIDEIWPVLFSGAIEHRRMEGLGRITSAGFVAIEGDQVRCYGESVSLEMGVGPEDVEIITAFLRRSMETEAR